MARVMSRVLAGRLSRFRFVENHVLTEGLGWI